MLAALGDVAVCAVVSDIERGLIHADLGGGVIKQRVSRSGQGKSGGFRVVILYRRGTWAFFVYGFPKNQRANISRNELAGLKELASGILAYGETEITKTIVSAVLIEVICGE